MNIYKNIDSENLDLIIQRTEKSFEGLKGMDVPRIRKTFKIGREVIQAYRDGHDNVVVEAPTGFGKTFLGFFIGIITKEIDHFLWQPEDIELKTHKSVYVLTPNKFLQEQYESDIKKFDFEMIMMKGQANYICDDKKVPFPERPCDSESLSNLAAGKTKFACADICTFIQTRKKCIESDVSVLNYHYWLTVMNKIYSNLGGNAPFSPRKLTVFDEAHTLGKIVQDIFTVDHNINYFIKNVMAQIPNLRFMFPNDEYLKSITAWTFTDLMNAQVALINEYTTHKDFHMSTFDTVYDKYAELIDEFEKVIVSFTYYFRNVVDKVKNRRPDTKASDVLKHANKDERYFLEWYGEQMNKLNELNELKNIYHLLGRPSMVMNIVENNKKYYKTIEEFGEVSNYSLSFQCANESGLVENSVNPYLGHGLFMSATFGNIDDWCSQTGITNYYKIKIPQIFTYEKSPIYRVTPMLSMNYRDKHENLPLAIERILKLVDHHKGQRGLIHTGNFEVMNLIKNRYNPRILTYSNSAEKEDIIKLLQSKPDAVVCGPSLIEGVDLKDDLCRFMIFAKVPYLSLADELVKRKMRYYENWYSWITMTSIQQGLGRSIRNDQDYCTTYFIDSGFETFFNRNKPDKYIEDRLKDFDITSI